MPSRFREDLATLEQRVVDARAAAAEALEFLRIRQAYPTLRMHEADQSIIRSYFEPDPVTLAGFIEAYSIEELPEAGQTLRQMLDTPKSVAEVKQEKLTLLAIEGLSSAEREQLQQRAFEEAQVKAANQKQPVVPQVPIGSPILPAHWDKSLIKRMTNEEIRSARIRFDREHGQGTFNAALTYRINGQDASELKRLYSIGE
jgi:hypothetical protein